MKLIIGSKVKFINENLEGEIIAIHSKNKVVVSCSDGFEHEIAVSELLIISKDNEHLYSIDEVKILNKLTSKTKIKRPYSILSKYVETDKYKDEGLLEIDLHLEKLVEFPSKLEDWQKLHTQMQYVKNCLNAAIDKKIRRVVFIHGVGTGVLKTELNNYLASIDKLIIKDADFRRYGMGATEVIIK